MGPLSIASIFVPQQNIFESFHFCGAITELHSTGDISIIYVYFGGPVYEDGLTEMR